MAQKKKSVRANYIHPLTLKRESKMYQLIFYVPLTHLEKVKDAVFDAGAGRYEDYDCCSWETEGIGQFRPLDDADPFIGTQNELEKIIEYRVEMVVKDEVAKDVLEALISAHPYEEPAYSLIKILTIEDF